MAAALTLGLRGHHVVILEAAPKVCVSLGPWLWLWLWSEHQKFISKLLTDDHE